MTLPAEDQRARDENRTPVRRNDPPRNPLPGRDQRDPQNTPPRPRDETSQAAAGIPGGYQVWRVGGQWMLVYLSEIPGPDAVPIAYTIDSITAARLGVTLVPERELTTGEFAAMGGLPMGDASFFLNNPSVRPFEGLQRMFERALPVMPWLADPEVYAVWQIAALEGRAPFEWELASTNWWRTRTEEERAAIRLAAQDPASYQRRVEDNRITWLQALRDIGMTGETLENMAQIIADNVTRGAWSETYAAAQARLLADPFLEGDLDPALSRAGLTGTRDRERQVMNLMQTWLGPTFGTPAGDFVARWASRLRQDPEGGLVDLEAELARQRMALFPAHENPQLTYEDIAQPVRSLWAQEWGQLAEETSPLFARLMNTTDLGGVGRALLVRTGINRGIPRPVTNTALEMAQAFNSGGGQVR